MARGCNITANLRRKSPWALYTALESTQKVLQSERKEHTGGFLSPSPALLCSQQTGEQIIKVYCDFSNNHKIPQPL